MAPTRILGRQRQIVLVTGTVICCMLLASASVCMNLWRNKPAIGHTAMTMKKEWVKHVAVSRNATSARVLVMQTCGEGKYEQLLRVTRLANERWAGQQGYDYLSVVGNYAALHFQHGGREWLSTFNKAWMVAEIVNMSRPSYDYVFYMDGDAMVTDPLWDVRTLPSSLAGVMFAAHSGGSDEPWNINAGVMLWDLRHEVVTDWVARCAAVIEAAMEGNPPWDDQALLQYALRDKLHALGLPKNNKTQPGINGLQAGRKAGIVAVLPNHWPSHAGQIVHHIMRPPGDAWSGNSVATRIAQASRDFEAIQWARRR
ncbi:hypothetical protein T484DRAFT_1964133 [Baffinella frigidus]|nr:hypothetical protein T484DRAFT_1964133 [Cryptophyta sp. CCMP2293]|mmetsp:Transcript_507/g.1387  ORF Transcript_507/g.1387 Transcript_507/m.1387 type:complete len:313 (+) Transcript_507:138-1076(+)